MKGGGKRFGKQNFNSNASAVTELARPRGTKGEAETSGIRSLTGGMGVQAQIPGLKWVRPGFLMPLMNAITQELFSRPVALVSGFGGGARRKKNCFPCNSDVHVKQRRTSSLVHESVIQMVTSRPACLLLYFWNGS